ncbi:hypothetical protein RHS01_09056 [Rhizoctonia solani]|uniref:Uncharacterized protein n=1 Tax=Rhizoctonia solani TaxID=456999 RepID=A0A8H7I6F7_9AGAM|nr:hypothetical protein RHS01_09056 [Rhizoctonia solani]
MRVDLRPTSSAVWPRTHRVPRHENWFGPPTHEPDSRPGAPGPPSLLRSRGGSPNLTGLGLVADKEERAEDNFDNYLASWGELRNAPRTMQLNTKCTLDN